MQKFHYLEFEDSHLIEDMDSLPDFSNLTIIEQCRQYPPLGWKEEFKKGDKELAIISQKLEERGDFYPTPRKLLFFSFRTCPPTNIKVVILGQDPYPDPRDAMGISFSTPEGRPVRPSLRIIYKELERCYEDFIIPKHGCLLPWVEQGVFLLNYCLTYHPDNPLKGKDLNIWMIFLRIIIEKICNTNPNAIFVLWGKKALEIKPRIKGCKILEAPHPSPIGGNNFIGCNHFVQINEHLVSTGQIPIDWRLA